MTSATYPLNLTNLSSSAEASAILSSYLRNYDDPGEKVDFSDFKNHVWFNSAKNKFDIFLYNLFYNYRRDFSWDEYYTWFDTLSHYEKYSFKDFPSWRGYFHNSASNCAVVGQDYENKMALTASQNALSIEFVFNLTSSNNIQQICKVGRDSNFYEVFLSSSSGSIPGTMIFKICSGSTSLSASCEFSTSYFDIGHHIAFCYESSSFWSTINAYLDSNLIFASTSFSTFIENLIPNTGSHVFVACSSSNGATADSNFITGSIDELRIWNSYRTQQQIQTYYNRRIYWEPELKLYLKFNEPHYVTIDGSFFNKVFDHSKNGIDFQIVNYLSSSRGSGSILNSSGNDFVSDFNEYWDPILLEDHPDVISYINNKWTTAKEFDNSNRYLITNLVPQSYLEEEASIGTFNFTNMLYIFARQLDEMKLHIKHVGNFYKTHGNYDVIPYKLLKDAIGFFGLKSFDNFSLADISDVYLDKYSITDGVLRSIKEINYSFWMALLNNLIYVYKTKGTKESIKTMLNCLGLGTNVISMKEYSSQYQYPVTNSFINNVRYSKVLNFGGRPDNEMVVNTNSTSSFAFITSSQLPFPLTNSFTVETLVAFKPYIAYESGTFYDNIIVSQPLITTGSIWGISHNVLLDNTGGELCLAYTRELTSSYGTIMLVASGVLEGTPVYIYSQPLNIFNGDFYNIAYRRNGDAHYIDIRKLENGDQIKYVYSGYSSFPSGTNNIGQFLCIGGFPLSFLTQYVPSITCSETVQTEFRIWNTMLSSSDLDAHCLNYTSVGINSPESNYYNLIGHYILDDDIASVDDIWQGQIWPITNYSYYKESMDATGAYFISNTNNFYTHLFDYNFLCPQISLQWDTNKIQYVENELELERIDDKNRVDVLTAELNMVDALNEDIMRLYSNINDFSHYVGSPYLQYRNKYLLHSASLAYFTRLSGNPSFSNYFDNLSWLDNFYFEIIKNLVPARAYSITDEKVIESHALERAKTVLLRQQNIGISSMGSALTRMPRRVAGLGGIGGGGGGGAGAG